MSHSAKAFKAYESANQLRGQREQDAEVFRTVSSMLRAADDDLSRTRALATARRLWQTILATNLDPLNPLPAPLRAQIVSVANNILQQTNDQSPDLEVIAIIGDNFAEGLSGRA
ncbi:flagellar biosynthesis regulator FlaF [Acidiphilium cryptum]|nr:flagellar biosynthesis regulator FlaF [Acidiphilium cryptum]